MVTKVGQLSAVHTEIFSCTKCPLHAGRTRTVPGAGHPDAEIMFIGEAPGFHEDQQGLPFVGKSGQYLTELLHGIGFSRDDVFIANVVKCRPPNNRDPNAQEIETCNPYLRSQIDIIDPLVIATLGRYSTGMFFPNAAGITSIHGQPKYGTVRAYLPLFHPAYVLRYGDMRPLMEADFARLPDVVAEVKRRRESGEMGDAAIEQKIIQMPNPEEPDDDPKQMGLFD